MATKKAVNVSIDAELLARARAEGLNLSALMEREMRQELGRRDAERWKAENAEAIAAWNAYLEEHGLPLEKLRMF